MDTIRKNELIAKVNKDLSINPKHVEITMDDIEKVYGRNVLGIQADAKTRKGTKKGYMTGIMYFAPASLSGINICTKSSAGCRDACLFSAGRGRFYSIHRARIVKTLAYHFDTPRFMLTIVKSIRSLLVKAKNTGLTPIVRLNGTSDILWERLRFSTDPGIDHNMSTIMELFPDVQFYDYTKIAKRFLFTIPKNYHLTFSVSESNDADAKLVLSKGYSVAAVFRKDLPVTLWGYPVTNGDETDLRFLDARGVVVGLKAKGKAKQDASGFVRDAAQCETKAA